MLWVRCGNAALLLSVLIHLLKSSGYRCDSLLFYFCNDKFVFAFWCRFGVGHVFGLSSPCKLRQPHHMTHRGISFSETSKPGWFPIIYVVYGLGPNHTLSSGFNYAAKASIHFVTVIQLSSGYGDDDDGNCGMKLTILGYINNKYSSDPFREVTPEGRQYQSLQHHLTLFLLLRARYR